MPLLLPKTASKNIWSFQNATVPQRGLLIFHWLDGENIFLNQFCISSQAHSLPLGFKGHRKQLQFVQIISPKFCWQKEEKNPLISSVSLLTGLPWVSYSQLPTSFKKYFVLSQCWKGKCCICKLHFVCTWPKKKKRNEANFQAINA